MADSQGARDMRSDVMDEVWLGLSRFQQVETKPAKIVMCCFNTASVCKSDFGAMQTRFVTHHNII
jgi:hypothetical protein